MIGRKEIPSHDQLQSYNHAVAGHAGTLCDSDGELFIKPCTEAEIEFYHSANRRHPEFASLMPLFMGTLALNDPSSIKIEDTVHGFVTDHGVVETRAEHIAHKVQQGLAQTTPSEAKPEISSTTTWLPNKSRKIQTDRAVVLENASHGYKQPNILDCKLGTRLWADDAAEEKKQRFELISKETTHKNLGFRIAGMRAYRGSEDAAQLDDNDYKIYDKDYGRFQLNDDNVKEGFRSFIFNKAAGIDEATGKAVCAAFAKDIKTVQEVLEKEESRMYSSSLLFVMEGDGEALRAAIKENNDAVERINAAGDKDSCRSTRRVDSGIVLDEERGDEEASDGDDEEDFSSLPKIYTLKLIDFAHARWTPGEGRDENTLKGVRSLLKIFEDLAQ